MDIVCERNGNCRTVLCNGICYKLNLIKSKVSPTDFRLKLKNRERRLGAKTNVDLRDIMPPIWDQGKVASCTAQAICATVYPCLREKFEPSRLFHYFCTRLSEGYSIQEDSGAEMKVACDVAIRHGFVPESSWPYIDENFAKKPSKECFSVAKKYKQKLAYTRLDNDVESMIYVLDEGYPFVIGVFVTKQWFSPDCIRTGNLEMIESEEDILGGHAVVCVGYDLAKRVFILRNSWGNKWGDNGYCYIPFDYLSHQEYALDAFVLRCVKIN